jgi:peptide/nickel transport system ATP-binding protein
MSAPACSVQDVSHVYRLRRERRVALEDVSFEVTAGRTLGVVGESGAGKSTLVRLLAGLEQPTSGRVEVEGKPVRLRPGTPSPVQMVFQNPLGALNPHRSVGASIAEAIQGQPRDAREDLVRTLMDRVGLAPARAVQRPSRFSGGQLQRVVLARAIAARPRVLLCDEPTSALDVSVQAQIINLILELQAEQRFACVLVTHDLGVAKVLVDDVLVLLNGRVQEQQSTAAFFEGPRSAYGRSLLASVA